MIERWRKMKMYSEEELLEVAKEMIDGLDNDINEIIDGLKCYMEEKNKTLEEVRELGWEDSTVLFNYIYS